MSDYAFRLGLLLAPELGAPGLAYSDFQAFANRYNCSASMSRPLTEQRVSVAAVRCSAPQCKRGTSGVLHMQRLARKRRNQLRNKQQLKRARK